MIDISIIIPTYKPQFYLFKCLDSLRNQTLSPDKFEILLVLNGCYEPYLSEIKAYILKYSVNNIHLFQTDEPGVSNARNLALDRAVGRYITFIDDDDIVSSNYLLSLLEKADEKALVVSDERIFVENIFQCSMGYISRAFRKFKFHDKNNIYFKRSFLSSSCCKIIPKILIGASRFNTAFKVGEDSLFMFSISKDVKEIRLADDAIYYRRCRTGSASRVKKTKVVKIKTCLMQIKEYSCIYMKSPFRYNFFLFLSRIIASAIHVIR